MNFEQALLKLLQIGCPECGNKDKMELWLKTEYLRMVSLGGIEKIQYKTVNPAQEPENSEVICGNCSTVIWTSEDGWIELLGTQIYFDPRDQL